MNEFQYELLIEDMTPFLINIGTGERDYEIVCIDITEKYIKVKGLNFVDSIKMSVSNIKGFRSQKMRDVLPECYI